jgi:hypothetical protein
MRIAIQSGGYAKRAGSSYSMDQYVINAMMPTKTMNSTMMKPNININKLYRTLMTVTRVEGGRVYVVMGQWNGGQEVSFQSKKLPKKHRAQKPGGILIAQVNIEAEKEDLLVFENFEWSCGNPKGQV